MSLSRGEQVAIGGGLAYLIGLAWAIGNTSYDIWGALVVVPVYGVLGILGLRWMFQGELEPVSKVMYWGLLIKLGGALARYWVGFEAYGGGIDASAYHDHATQRAHEVRTGQAGVLDIFDGDIGTEFVEQFTTMVYVVTGGSQLAGFVTFSFLAFWGTAFMVKAGVIAIPGLAATKYAWLCVLFPSLVYWPSSIGKDALMLFGLGIGTYGIAVMLTQRRWIKSVVLVALGLGFAAFVRPHISGVWLAAALPALLLAFVLGRRRLSTGDGRQKGGRLGIVAGLAVAAVALSLVSSVALRFLEPDDDSSGTTSITEILEETTRRTGKLGSNFEPPTIDSPASWPFAVVRTLTRPLPLEARGLAQLLSAAEIVVLFGVYALSWRRVRNLPRMLFTNPYVTFAMTTVFLGGLVYSSFANLGILTRQKALLVPFLLLVACLPLRIRGAKQERDGPRPTAADEARDDRLPTVVATRRTALSRSAAGAAVMTDEELDELWA